MRSVLLFFSIFALFAADNTSEVLMPLNAYGVATNATVQLLPENRFNPTQFPQTNNLRLYQTKAWTTGGTAPTLTYDLNTSNRSAIGLGPYFGTVGLTGPGLVFPLDATVDFIGNNTSGPPILGMDLATFGTDGTAETNMCATKDGDGNFAGYNRPTITSNTASIAIVFNADEFSTAPAAGFDEDDIVTTVDPYGLSLQMVYTTGNKSITDYVVMGNPFHDVFYDDLTPRILSNSNISLIDDSYVDDVSIGPVIGGQVVGPGKNFRFPISSSSTSQIYLMLFAENPAQDELFFEVNVHAGAPTIILTATDAGGTPLPYTGWLRAVFIREGDMDVIETSNVTALSSSGQSTTVPVLSTPASINAILTPDWANEVEVQAISNIPASYWTLYPHAWMGRVSAQTLFHTTENSSGSAIEWPGTANGFYRNAPNAMTTAFLLPILTFDNGTDVVPSPSPPSLFDFATDILEGTGSANGLSTNLAAYGGAFPTAPAPYGSSTMSLFTLAFLMGYTHGQAGAATTFQDGWTYTSSGDTLPTHSGSNVSSDDMATFLIDNYSSAIPTKIDEVIFTPSTNVISFTYEMATDNAGYTQDTDPLIAFPGWMNPLSASHADFVFDTAIKGKLFTTNATGGQIDFEEKDWSGAPGNWIESGDFLPPFTDLDTLFGGDTDATTVLGWLSDIYNDELFPGVTAPPSNAWPTQVQATGNSQEGISQPLFMDENTLLGGYGSGQIFFQLANTALLMSTYLEDQSIPTLDIIAATEPLMDYVKRRIADYIINRPQTQNALVPDTTNHGICFYGNPELGIGNATPAPAPSTLYNQSLIGTEQQTGILQVDFVNPQYNDHILQYGYYLQAIARIIEWDNTYVSTTSDRFINQRVVGADHNTYTMRHFVDTIWRDMCNPFIETDGFPFLRFFNLWEGHPEAQGTINPPAPPAGTPLPLAPGDPLLNQPNLAKGRNIESIAEAYSSLSGTFYYAVQVLNEGGLTGAQTTFYENLRDRMLLLMKHTVTSSRVLWYLEGSGYKTSGGGSEIPSFFNGYFKNYCLTTGNVNDTSVDSSVAFLQGPAVPALATCP